MIANPEAEDTIQDGETSNSISSSPPFPVSPLERNHSPEPLSECTPESHPPQSNPSPTSPPKRCPLKKPRSLRSRSSLLLTETTIEAMVFYICSRLDQIFPAICATPVVTSNPSPESEAPVAYIRPEAFYRLFYKVKHFFQIISAVSMLVASEMIHVVYLVDQLITREVAAIAEGWTPIVSDGNLGTLLLCAVLVSLKMNRDHPFSNGWWAVTVDVPLPTINQSELVFLQRVGYSLMMSEDEYLRLFIHLCGNDKPSCSGKVSTRPNKLKSGTKKQTKKHHQRSSDILTAEPPAECN